MSANGKTRADDLLAAALASGCTVADAAAKAGVSESTTYKRLRSPDFAARVQELRSEMVRRAAGTLADAMAEAATVLRGLLTSQSEGVQLRAADRLLSLGLQVLEMSELQQRIEELERRLTPEGDNR